MRLTNGKALSSGIWKDTDAGRRHQGNEGPLSCSLVGDDFWIFFEKSPAGVKGVDEPERSHYISALVGGADFRSVD